MSCSFIIRRTLRQLLAWPGLCRLSGMQAPLDSHGRLADENPAISRRRDAPQRGVAMHGAIHSPCQFWARHRRPPDRNHCPRPGRCPRISVRLLGRNIRPTPARCRVPCPMSSASAGTRIRAAHCSPTFPFRLRSRTRCALPGCRQMRSPCSEGRSSRHIMGAHGCGPELADGR